MKIVLFAYGQVGLAVVRHFADMHIVPALLVVVKDDAVWSARIRSASNACLVAEWEKRPTEVDIEQMRTLAPDLGITAWWPYLLRPEVFEIPQMGCLNFHPSLLPYGRGKHPNFWSIREGVPFGVTLQFIDAGIDTGDIAFQEEIPVTWEDTGGTLHQKALDAIVTLFKKHFEEIISGRIPRRQQDAAAATSHLAKELAAASHFELDKEYCARDLLNLIRARTYAPHPGAEFVDGGETFEVRVEIRKKNINSETT